MQFPHPYREAGCSVSASLACYNADKSALHHQAIKAFFGVDFIGKILMRLRNPIYGR